MILDIANYQWDVRRNNDVAICVYGSLIQEISVVGKTNEMIDGISPLRFDVRVLPKEFVLMNGVD